MARIRTLSGSARTGFAALMIASTAVASVAAPAGAANPTFAWVAQGGGADAGWASDVAVLSDGSSVITGKFSGTITFGQLAPLVSDSGSIDIYVAKTDPAGNFVWATSAGGPMSDYGFAIAAGSDGSTIITGQFAGTAAFPGLAPLVSAGSADIVVAKLDSTGTFLWARRAGGLAYDQGLDVTVLTDGSAVMTGDFTNSASFGAVTLDSPALANVDTEEVFVAKIDSTGVFQWATGTGGTGDDEGRGVQAMADGSVIVCGFFVGTVAFGGTDLVGAGGPDVFVAKLSAAGALQWAVRAGGTGVDIATRLALLSDGSAVVAGYSSAAATFGTTTLTSAGSTDVFVAKVAPAGSFQWATGVGGVGNDYSYDVAVLSDGSSFVVGRFTDTVAFGSTTLTSNGSTDVFVAKIGASGGVAGVVAAGGTGVDDARGVAVLTDGSAIVAGQFEGTVAFPGASSLTATGTDPFVAKVVVPTASGVAAPTNTALPAISGMAFVGQTLSADPGTWSGATNYSYSWQQCDGAGLACVTLTAPSAEATYVPATTDVGHTLRVVVTATGSGGSRQATSPATAAIAAPPRLRVRIPGVETVDVVSGIRIRSEARVHHWRIDFSRPVREPGVGRVTTIRGWGRPPDDVQVVWRNGRKVTLTVKVVTRSGLVLYRTRVVDPVYA